MATESCTRTDCPIWCRYAALRRVVRSPSMWGRSGLCVAPSPDAQHPAATPMLDLTSPLGFDAMTRDRPGMTTVNARLTPSAPVRVTAVAGSDESGVDIPEGSTNPGSQRGDPPLRPVNGGRFRPGSGPPASDDRVIGESRLPGHRHVPFPWASSTSSSSSKTLTGRSPSPASSTCSTAVKPSTAGTPPGTG